jgi:hypothetical protein
MLRPIFGFQTAAAFCASAALLAACSGKVVSPGPVATLEPLALSELNKPVVACGGGYAHSNVCCEGGPGKASSCGVYPGAPFQACGSGYATYPNPESCCPIDGSGDCIAPPPSPPPPTPGCSYACPPGQYQPDGDPTSCCFQQGDVIVCSGGSGVSGGSGGTTCPPPPVCSCPVCLEGETCSCVCEETTCSSPPPPVCECPECADGPCPPCDCGPSPPPAPTCPVCPPGWQVPQGEPLLCCNASGGAIECFSQGVPPPPTPVPQPLPAQTGSGQSSGGHTQ